MDARLSSLFFTSYMLVVGLSTPLLPPFAPNLPNPFHLPFPPNPAPLSLPPSLPRSCCQSIFLSLSLALSLARPNARPLSLPPVNTHPSVSLPLSVPPYLPLSRLHSLPLTPPALLLYLLRSPAPPSLFLPPATLFLSFSPPPLLSCSLARSLVLARSLDFALPFHSLKLSVSCSLSQAFQLLVCVSVCLSVCLAHVMFFLSPLSLLETSLPSLS